MNAAFTYSAEDSSDTDRQTELKILKPNINPYLIDVVLAVTVVIA